jgi:hypothetical protein
VDTPAVERLKSYSVRMKAEADGAVKDDILVKKKELLKHQLNLAESKLISREPTIK